MALTRRVLRMLREHLWRYIGVFVLILLGSWTFVVVGGLTRNLEASAIDFTQQNVQEDLYFTTAQPLPDLPGLEWEYNAAIEEYQSTDVALTDTRTLRLVAETQKVNLPAVLKGRALESPREILLDPAFAAANGYAVGSEVAIGGRTFRVVGTVALPQYIYPVQGANDLMALPETFGLGVVSPEDMEGMPGSQRNYSVKFTDAGQSLNGQMASLHQRLAADGVEVADWTPAANNKRIQIVWTSITSMEAMGAPLAIAMFLLSCLIIGIMIWRMIKQESVIIGALYAQGLRRRELTRHYMALPLGIALAGGLAGSLLAVPCVAPAVRMITQSYILPTTQLQAGVGSVLAGVLMPALALGFSSWLVIRRQLKRPAAQLMKGGAQSSKVNALERFLKLERFRFAAKFRIREQLRSISRLVFLLLGVTSASALMLFGFAIASSYSEVFGGSGDVYGFEYEYAYREPHTQPTPDGAEVFTNGLFYPPGDESIEFNIVGIQPDSAFLHLADAKGAALPNSQTNITQALASRLGVKAGGSVELIHKLTDRPYTIRIDGVADTYSSQTINMPIDELNAMLENPPGSYVGLWSLEKLEIPENELAGMKTMSEIGDSVNQMLQPLIASMGAIILVACVVALIILYLVTSLVIEENRTTISMFRVFGYRKKEVRSLVLNSATGAVVAGFLISIPLLFASMRALFGYIGAMVNVVLPARMNPLYILICFGLVLLTYQLSKLTCAKKVNQIAMAEALKAGVE